MKWISPRPGVYKYVSDDNAAPPVTPPDKQGIPNLISKVPWADLEEGVHAQDSREQIKATDAFLEERRKWTGTSAKLRNWEANRKKEWAKNKPLWKKEQVRKEQVQLLKDLASAS